MSDVTFGAASVFFVWGRLEAGEDVAPEENCFEVLGDGCVACFGTDFVPPAPEIFFAVFLVAATFVVALDAAFAAAGTAFLLDDLPAGVLNGATLGRAAGFLVLASAVAPGDFVFGFGGALLILAEVFAGEVFACFAAAGIARFTPCARRE